MKTIELKETKHNVKINDTCKYYEPNVTEDCLLKHNNDVIGFYISDVGKYNKKLKKLLKIANNEFRSERVPKQTLNRSAGVMESYEKLGDCSSLGTVQQYSTILGSIAPRPHMRRPYPNISSVHRDKKAQIFIQAMWGACVEAEKVLKEITPHLYKRQEEIFKDVNKKWRFGNMFTSSISNYNISAPFHRDTGNIKNTVNIILTKRNNANGGCLNVPDYNSTFEQADNSMLVYPAWRNVHGVTPIKPIAENGYRNSLIFYPLKAFKGI